MGAHKLYQQPHWTGGPIFPTTVARSPFLAHLWPPISLPRCYCPVCVWCLVPGPCCPAQRPALTGSIHHPRSSAAAPGRPTLKPHTVITCIRRPFFSRANQLSRTRATALRLGTTPPPTSSNLHQQGAFIPQFNRSRRIDCPGRRLPSSEEHFFNWHAIVSRPVRRPFGRHQLQLGKWPSRGQSGPSGSPPSSYGVSSSTTCSGLP